MDRKETFELEQPVGIYHMTNSLVVLILTLEDDWVEWRYESGEESEAIYEAPLYYEDNTDRGGDIDPYFRHGERMFYLDQFLKINR